MTTAEYALQELTEREIEIARLVAQGLGNKQIAERIGTTVGGIRRSLENTFQKLSIDNRTMLAVIVQAWPGAAR